MVLKTEFFLPSSDGRSRIHGIHWIPEGKAVAVFQIVHGMIEYIDRYDEFAKYLAGYQIAVVGHDQLGHGKTSREEDFGYFADREGAACILGDICKISQYCIRQYPALPHFIMGHSMGSFFLRRYLASFQETLAGVILIGTGDQPLPVLAAGMGCILLMGIWKGDRYRSKFLHNIVLGNFNKSFRPTVTSYDWLTRDGAAAYDFATDFYCSFYFTCRAYCDFFQIMLSLKSIRYLKSLQCELPVLLLSGDKDPVGQRGRGVKRVFRSMKAAGIKDIDIKLYPGARHEILKEINKKEVFQDIKDWVLARV